MHRVANCGFLESDDQEEIRLLMDHFMMAKEGYLAGVKSRSQNLLYEGVKPMGAMTERDGTRTYALTNSDSNYMSCVGQIKLDDIDYCWVLDSALSEDVRDRLNSLTKNTTRRLTL